MTDKVKTAEVRPIKTHLKSIRGQKRNDIGTECSIKNDKVSVCVSGISRSPSCLKIFLECPAQQSGQVW